MLVLIQINVEFSRVLMPDMNEDPYRSQKSIVRICEINNHKVDAIVDSQE